MKHAVIRNGIIENIVEWDGVAAWTPPAGTTVELTEGLVLDIGWSWNEGRPRNPNPPATPQENAENKARALILRRAKELEKGDLAAQIESLRLRLSLIDGG